MRFGKPSKGAPSHARWVSDKAVLICSRLQLNNIWQLSLTCFLPVDRFSYRAASAVQAS